MEELVKNINNSRIIVSIKFNLDSCLMFLFKLNLIESEVKKVIKMISLI